MCDPDITPSHLISVETLAILFPSLDCFSDIFMVTDFNAFPFFQLSFTFDAIQIKGTWVIPEFPSVIILPILMVLTVLVVGFAKKILHQKQGH